MWEKIMDLPCSLLPKSWPAGGSLWKRQGPEHQEWAWSLNHIDGTAIEPSGCILHASEEQALEDWRGSLLVGPIYTIATLQQHYEVLGFAAPYVLAKSKATGKKGSLLFYNKPRVYFGWQED